LREEGLIVTDEISIKDIKDAAAVVHKATAFFKPLKQLDEALTALEAYGQTKLDLDRDCNTLKKNIADARIEAANVESALAALKKRKEEESALAGESLKTASAQAAKIVADANSNAGAKIQAAQAEAKKISDEAKALVAKLRADADAIKAELSDETKKLAAIKAAISKITGA
jgi:hypothetical protein